MGSYSVLFLLFSELYFCKNENDVFNKIKIKLEKYKNLNLNTRFCCSQINLLELIIQKQFTRILDLIINYDSTQINLYIIKNNIINDNKLLNKKLLQQYKKNIFISDNENNNENNNENYKKTLQKLIYKCIRFKYVNNLKLVCNELYRLNIDINELNIELNKYKTKLITCKEIKTILNFPSLYLPFNRSYKYPSEINKCLKICFKINLPYELINIICDFYVSNI